jgi:sensor histidine kinase YesM
MVDGVHVTTKKESGHGFGLRSIREIAEKYNGVASVQAEGNIFKLTVVLRP